MSLADQHLLRGLLALHALDARLHQDRGFYRLKNRFLEAVARREETTIIEYVDGDRMLWVAVSAMGYTFRMPGRLASEFMRERARFVTNTPAVTPPPEGDVDVEAERCALDEAGQALNGNKVPPPAHSASTGASA
jgi:hypothetical protein